MCKFKVGDMVRVVSPGWVYDGRVAEVSGIMQRTPRVLYKLKGRFGLTEFREKYLKECKNVQSNRQ